MQKPALTLPLCSQYLEENSYTEKKRQEITSRAIKLTTLMNCLEHNKPEEGTVQENISSMLSNAYA